MSVLDKHLVLLTLLQRNFTTMGMLQLLLQALRAPHSILEAAAATTAEGSSTQAAAPRHSAAPRHPAVHFAVTAALRLCRPAAVCRRVPGTKSGVDVRQ